MTQDSRRQARILALVCQYQRQKLDETSSSENRAFTSSNLPEKLQDFARLLLDTAANKGSEIDQMVEKNLPSGWKQSRLLEPLNALLRISIAELLAMPQTDSKVVFNESIELCRLYVSEGSTKLLNGLLHTISKEIGSR